VLLYAAVGHSDRWRDAFFSKYAWENPVYETYRKGSPRKPGQVVMEPEYYGSEFRNEYVVPQKVDRSLVGVVTHLNGAPLILTAQRDKADYSREQVAMFQGLVNHVRQAHALGQRLGKRLASAAAFQAAWEASLQPMLLLDGRGIIAYVNPAARDLLSRPCGVSLGLERLRPSDSQDAQALQRIIAAATRSTVPQSASMTVRAAPGELPVKIGVHPLNVGSELHSVGGPRIAAIVFLDRDRPPADLSASALQTRFRLTPAEARLALRLAQGQSLSDAAQEFQVEESTVRRQLQHIFWKTGTGRQAELVAALLRFDGSPAVP
jgi:DNA-binding CsgD family transcriptional regulator/PAS domain-containing protein